MTKQFGFSSLFLLFGVLVVVSVQGADDSQNSATPIEVNAANDFVSEDDSVVILDVRTPVEFEMSHIATSVNVDVQDESFDEMIAQLDRNKTYIVHCTKNPIGGRSGQALESMQKLGFTHLYSLEGGYLAWKDAGLPLTEKSD